MKVVIFCESEIWGGLETHTAVFAQTLIAAGHQVAVACVAEQGYALFRNALPPDVDVLKVVPSPRRTIRNWRRVLRHVAGDAAVLQKGTLRTGGWTLDVVLRLKFRRYIAILHLEPPVLPPRTSRRRAWGLMPGIGLWWYRWKWSGYLRSLGPHLTVCVSEAVRRRLVEDYGVAAARLVTVPNGVDSAKFRPNLTMRNEVRQVWKLPVNAFAFGSVGRLTRLKGLDVAIEAFASLVRDYPERPLYLVLVGEGEEWPNLLELVVRLGLRDRVVFPGFAQNPSMAYQGLDEFLLPSRLEALGLSLLEAMASECPVIATNVGGVPEVITTPSVGTLVPSDDSPALTHAMRDALLRSPEVREAQVLAARQRVVENFDARVQCAKIISLIVPADSH